MDKRTQGNEIRVSLSFKMFNFFWSWFVVLVFLLFMYINIHVQEHGHLIVAIYGRHDRDANSRSSLAVSDRSRGNSELQYFTDRHTSPALICASWGIIPKGDRPWTLYSIFQHIYNCSNFNLNPIIIPWSPCLLIRASRIDLRYVQEKYTSLTWLLKGIVDYECMKTSFWARFHGSARRDFLDYCYWTIKVNVLLL